MTDVRQRRRRWSVAAGTVALAVLPLLAGCAPPAPSASVPAGDVAGYDVPPRPAPTAPARSSSTSAPTSTSGSVATPTTASDDTSAESDSAAESDSPTESDSAAEEGATGTGDSTTTVPDTSTSGSDSDTSSSRTARATGPEGRAPGGVTRNGTWWQAPADQYSPGNLWFFDPVGEALPYGTRTGYQPTGTITPYSQQFAFTYEQSGTDLALSFPSGTRQSLTVLAYDEDADVVEVVWEGYRQQWVGCSSGLMPALALAACR